MNKPPSDSEIISALRSKGFKATSQRIAICRNVLRSRDHPTPQRVYDEVKKVHPTVSLATVYKTLGVLEELNLVQDLSPKHGEMRLDPNVEPHLNLVCRNCNAVRDVENDHLKRIIADVAGRERFSVSGERLIIYGLCESCTEKRE
jgi:Fur family peroxide stress response transcriptional regulator